jgi:hypothetical protein
MKLKDAFKRVYCVNLKRRQDRWEQFLEGLPDDWPFPKIERFEAIDGKKAKHPDWWKAGPGAWGCYRSHLRILEDCLNNGIPSVLLLEDDALFLPDFRRKVERFFKFLPEDWEMIYLGGQHLMIDKHPPLKINKAVFQPFNVNRTHAFGIRGDMIRVVYKHLLRNDWVNAQHIDHHLGRLHQGRDHRIYCPWEWLVGQAEGQSNISGRNPPDRFWAPAEQLEAFDAEASPLVVVIGLHSSGSSALAGVLHHLGLHLGNRLVGYYGTDPNGACGFEAVRLFQICEKAIPFPATERKIKRGELWAELRAFINEKKREAFFKGTLAALKYPQLCQMGPQLRNLCGKNLRVIHIDRPIEDSIRSMQKRPDVKRNGIKPRDVAEHQRWLAEGKQDLLQSLPPSQVLTVRFKTLLSHPRVAITQIKKFLRIKPTREQIQRALDSVDPSKQTVKGDKQ